MEITDKIWQLAEKNLKNESQFIVEIIASFKRIPKKLLVILDGDQGVTIDDCADMSRALSEALDESGLMEDKYMLEVSTPGLDHPLKLKRQYRKNIGRSVKVKLNDKTVEGVLSDVTENSITLTQASGKGKKKVETQLTFPFDEIEKTFVLISFK